MESKDDMKRSKSRRTTLAAFAKNLQRESHVLKDNPDLLWQQLFNRLQWEFGEKGGQISKVLTREYKKRIFPNSRPWLQ